MYKPSNWIPLLLPLICRWYRHTVKVRITIHVLKLPIMPSLKSKSVNPNKAEALLVTLRGFISNNRPFIFYKPIQLKIFGCPHRPKSHLVQTINWYKNIKIKSEKKLSRQCGLAGRPFGTDGARHNPNFVDHSVDIPSNSFAQSFSVVGSYQQERPCYQSD